MMTWGCLLAVRWEEYVEDGRTLYVNLTTMTAQDERPYSAAGWSPYTF
jgi:hypothetical protein